MNSLSPANSGHPGDIALAILMTGVRGIADIAGLSDPAGI